MSRCLAISLFLALPSLVSSFPPRHTDVFNPLGPWHKRSKPCGLPKFIKDLPDETAQKIEKIWGNYTDGAECEKEHDLTRQVLRQLSTEQRDKIFAGKCGPSFLRNVSATVRQEFKTVWFNLKLSSEDKQLSLQKLAYSLLSGESLALFNKWEEELKIRKEEINKKVSALSPNAREAFEQWKELRLKEKLFLAGLSEDIRSELKTLFGHGPNIEEPSTTTTTAKPTTVKSTVDSTDDVTTIAPAFDEQSLGKEFSLFLFSQPPEDFLSENQCHLFV
ncbi:unnamed protein product [Caenorhabditis sp. 36 PRJEB53466]|nr:unnamed protein product [Caenorhabditis sp. 36 PRJEB53466]